MDTLEIINPEHNLLLHQQVIQISNHVSKQFEGLPNQDLVKLKNDEQFILHIMNIVENVFVEKKMKKRKREIVIMVLQKLIPVLTDDDKNQIMNKIEFLHSNNLIKQVKRKDVILHKLFNFFLPKAKA